MNVLGHDVIKFKWKGGHHSLDGLSDKTNVGQN